ncbi:MAG: HAD family hydrolase [Anaerolineales bacterium]
MPKLRAIAFDLDDTLYPEREYALSGFRAVAEWAEAALGVPRSQVYAELKGLFESGVRRNSFNRWLEGHGLPPDTWLDDMLNHYRQHVPELSPFPGAAELLETLYGTYRMAILTQGYAAGQRSKIKALGVEHYFETILILDETEREQWKPSRRAFERLLAQLKLRSDEVAYVGDNPEKDFYGARQLGIRTVRIRRPGGEHAHKEPIDPCYAPDVQVNEFSAVPEALKLEPRLIR